MEWTQFQQNKLQEALKKFPNSLPVQERWTKIAEEVPGKNMKECVQRFKDIRKKLAEKKNNK